jgi:hypothetical protein
METINLKISLIPKEVNPIKPIKSEPTLGYELGYGIGQMFKKKPKVVKELNLFKTDWCKDYSDLNLPTVIRRERKNG